MFFRHILINIFKTKNSLIHKRYASTIRKQNSQIDYPNIKFASSNIKIDNFFPKNDHPDHRKNLTAQNRSSQPNNKTRTKTAPNANATAFFSLCTHTRDTKIGTFIKYTNTKRVYTSAGGGVGWAFRWALAPHAQPERKLFQDQYLIFPKGPGAGRDVCVPVSFLLQDFAHKAFSLSRDSFVVDWSTRGLQRLFSQMSSPALRKRVVHVYYVVWVGF